MSSSSCKPDLLLGELENERGSGQRRARWRHDNELRAQKREQIESADDNKQTLRATTGEMWVADGDATST